MDKPSGSVPEQVQQFAPKPKSRKDGPTDDLRGLLHRAAGIFSNEKYRRTGDTPPEGRGREFKFSSRSRAQASR